MLSSSTVMKQRRPEIARVATTTMIDTGTEMEIEWTEILPPMRSALAIEIVELGELPMLLASTLLLTQQQKPRLVGPEIERHCCFCCCKIHTFLTLWRASFRVVTSHCGESSRVKWSRIESINQSRSAPPPTFNTTPTVSYGAVLV